MANSNLTVAHHKLAAAWRCGRWFAFALLITGVWNGAAGFAHAAVISGVVEAVAPATSSMSIRILSTDKLTTVRLSPTATITVDGRPAKLADVKVGQTASVTTQGTTTVATKVTARNADTASTPQTPAPMPKPAPSSTPSSTPSERRSGNNSISNVAAGGDDWPQYRGANRDNINRETGLLTAWPERGPELLWTATGLGQGYSAVVVAGDSIYTLGSRDDSEYLFALNRDNGEIRWATRMGRLFREGTGDGPRGTPAVDGEFVYGLSAQGDLVCARTSDGNAVWQMNILETFQGNNIVWGISESVLIDGDKLICTPGGRQATMVALDKRNGRPIWRSVVPGTPQAGYASAIPVTIGNVKHYVNFVHNGVVGVRANDGTPLWGDRASANETANCSAPVTFENMVFTASGYGTGGALFRLASSGNNVRSEVVYTTREMKNHHGGMVLLDGHLYGFDEQILTCLEAKSGQKVWQNRSVGKGSLTCADGRLYLRGENGSLALAAASPDGYNETGRFDQPQRSGRPAWAHPVVHGGRLYVRDQDKLLVFNVRR